MDTNDKKTFRLEIISPQKILFSAECDFVVVPTTAGEIGVLHRHVPLMSIVSQGHIRAYKSGSIAKEMDVDAGILEATQEHVNILVNIPETKRGLQEE